MTSGTSRPQVSDEWKRWVDAASRLSEDPTAKVRCPRNGDEFLTVRDVPNPANPTQVERYLRCPGCGATNVVRAPRR